MTQLFDVLGLDPSDSIVRAVAFALPTAVLLTLLVLWRVKARSKSKRAGVVKRAAPVGDRDSAPEAPAAIAAVPAPVARTDEAPAAPISEAARKAAGLQVQTAHHAPAVAPVSTPAQPAAPAAAGPANEPPAPAPFEPEQATPQAATTEPIAPTAPPAALDIASIKAQFEEAVKSAPKTALAPLYLEYASQCRKSGDEAACVAALRSAAGYGALHGPRVAHAAARVELAEVAYSSGDAIGACEQWQIARLVLHEEGLKDAYARIDKRMRDNGCPTDWVLTDF